MSIILAIESSTDIASVALSISQGADLAGSRLSSREVGGVQSHSLTVLPMVQALLAEAGLRLCDCDAIGFGAGPGSFTGVRTACGIAQGLAFGSGLPVLAVDTLMAAAQRCRDETGAADVLVVLDARMGEVYWGQYRWQGAPADAGWLAIVAARLDRPQDVAAQVQAIDGIVSCGNGIAMHSGLFARGHACMPHAAQVAWLAHGLLVHGKAVHARDAQPVYLRNDVAQTTAERAQRRAEAEVESEA